MFQPSCHDMVVGADKAVDGQIQRIRPIGGEHDRVGRHASEYSGGQCSGRFDSSLNLLGFGVDASSGRGAVFALVAFNRLVDGFWFGPTGGGVIQIDA